jgi:TPP-dependent pyruvate/acetoin dehydrogenase alpha subunit
MMRMKGHAIHDAAEYVPKPLFEYWRKRDPISRLEKYLLDKKWFTPGENEELIASVEKQLDADREFAVASPMPAPETAASGVYCEPGCHEIQPKYGVPKVSVTKTPVSTSERETVVHLK